MLQLANGLEPPQPTTHPNPPTPPPATGAELAQAQLAAILASAEDSDEASRAHVAKELFRFLVTTSEKLAEAQSLLRKHDHEAAERERVR